MISHFLPSFWHSVKCKNRTDFFYLCQSWCWTFNLLCKIYLVFHVYFEMSFQTSWLVQILINKNTSFECLVLDLSSVEMCFNSLSTSVFIIILICVRFLDIGYIWLSDRICKVCAYVWFSVTVSFKWNVLEVNYTRGSNKRRLIWI